MGVQFFKICFLSLLLFCFTPSIFGNKKEIINHWETVVNSSDIWSYVEGLSPLPDNWYSFDFDDSGWKTGPGGLGYGDNDDNTIVLEANSLFLRKKFQIVSTESIGAVYFQIDYDDGFIAYLNGVEIARSLMDGEFPPYNELTIDQHEANMYSGGKPEQFIVDESLWKNLLHDGENILAIQVHNSSENSSDMTAIAFLTLGITDDSRNYRPTPFWFDAPFSFTSSNLPIVIIETENGGQIKDEPKVKAKMKIINNPPGQINHVSDTPNDYDGNVGIEIRGSYSASLPQKPYGIETRDSLGENNNVNLLGMPKENDWILLANYNDKSFMRNSLPFHLFEKMGHYAPRSRSCEVVVNGEYEGIYIFTERIKIDKNRVDIAKLDPDDNAGDSVTGGYIFKIDYPDNFAWKSNFSPLDNPNGKVMFVNHDPEGDEITEEQQNYLMWFVNQFETTLYSSNFRDPLKGYRSFIDVETFIDYFIIGEVSRNVDAYKKSRYLYKDKESKGGLLCSGPVWDFDWAWKNLNDCSLLKGHDGSGWAYQINQCNVWPTPPAWIVRFLEDPLFVDQVYTRYSDLRETILSNEYIENYADSVATLLEEAQKRHYARWPILGKNTGAPETDKLSNTYSEEVEKLVNWIEVRLNWLDLNLYGRYITSDVDFALESGLNIFPNPARDFITINADQLIKDIEIYNLKGKLVVNTRNINDSAYQLSTSNLDNGIYLIRVISANNKYEIKRIMLSK